MEGFEIYCMTLTDGGLQNWCTATVGGVYGECGAKHVPGGVVAAVLSPLALFPISALAGTLLLQCCCCADSSVLQRVAAVQRCAAGV